MTDDERRLRALLWRALPLGLATWVLLIAAGWVAWRLV